MEGEEVDRVVSPPILKRVREEEQRDSPLRVTGEWGSHTEDRVKGTDPAVKSPPGTRNPEGGGWEKGAGRNPEVHPGTGMSIRQVARWEDRPSCGVGSSSGESAEEGGGTLRGPSVVRGSARFHLGYGSSGEESSEEGEGTPVDTDTEVSMGGEPVQGQEGTSIGGQSPDDESGAVLEEPEGKEEGCREPLRGDQALFPRGMMSGGEMDLVGGNKPVEIPDPEDSSTMEESVVTFSGQRRKEPLVGDLVSSPESVGSSMEKREDAVLGMDIYRLGEMGPGKMQDRIQRMFPRGEGWEPRSPERGTPNPWWGTGPSHRRVLG